MPQIVPPLESLDKLPLSIDDLDWFLEQSRDDVRALRGERIFITGGTGFVGSWLLESLVHADRTMGLGLRMRVLSRDPERFIRRFPHLDERASLTYVKGDLLSLEPDGSHYGLVIHAGTDASAQLKRDQPQHVADTTLIGTKRVLQFAERGGTRRMLMLSSGVVYGALPPGAASVPEGFLGGPDYLDPANAYSEAKRMAEMLCAIRTGQSGLEIPIARLFAFVGPRLPLDLQYAVGNFIRDGLTGGPIRVHGDGSPIRSYLYGAELVVWLLAILIRGRSRRAYNVGSDEAVTIRQLAEIVAGAFEERPGIEIENRSDHPISPNRYVPDVERMRNELSRPVRIALAESVSRTVKWLRSCATGPSSHLAQPAP